MRDTLRRCWPAVKTLLSLAVLAFVGWRFYKDLSAAPDLFSRPLAWLWLLPAALCYLAGLSLSALYWRRLMIHLGQPAPLLTTFRAYFVGQLGKYVPGKALALVMRAGFMRGAGTSVGLAGLTAFYEVLVTMAAGAIIALLLFVLTDPADVLAGRGEGLAYVFRLHVPEGERIDRLTLVLFSFGLCLILLAFISPAVLNRLVKRVTTLFRLAEPPPLRAAWLGEGLLTTASCWLLFGLALACALSVVPGIDFGWSVATLAYLTAVMALAYVAGFFVPIPGAVGVREFFLYELLASASPTTDRASIVLAVLLLRLAWTAAEVVVAGVLYVVPTAGQPAAALSNEADNPPRSAAG